jgi:hypothetical protein
MQSMKKHVTFLVLFFCCFVTFSQNVPTTLQKKSILLEEFTGIHCGNCPSGHEIARNLMNANENAYVIAIHSGYFAIPNGSEPDYRIPEGEIIDKELRAWDYGYPSGTINRHPFGGEIIIGRGDWLKNAKAIHAEDAPVNILLTGTFDGSNRKLFIKTEGYYTLEVEETSHWLNIVVIENNIIGPQSGIGGGYDYVHNRMLRGFITPMDENIWGEIIESPKQGDFFEFEHEYLLPTTINGVQIKPENIEIIAFVCTEKTEVLNVTGIKPSYVNYEKPLLASLLKPVQEIGARYGFDFFEVQVKNLSDKTITSAKFEVTINGTVEEIEWIGIIHAFQTKPVPIKIQPYPINSINQYSIKLLALNSENIAGNTISGSFNAPIETTQKIFVEIKTDLHADENRFLIKDRDGFIVHELGPYPPNLVAIYKETVTLAQNETYCFEVIDEWWDGIKQPSGYFKMHNEDEELIVQAFDIKLWGDRVFIHTSRKLSTIDDNISKPDASVFYNDVSQTIDISLQSFATGRVDISLYSVTGQLMTEKKLFVAHAESNKISLPATKYGKGVYILKINQGSQSIAKKIVKI